MLLLAAVAAIAVSTAGAFAESGPLQGSVQALHLTVNLLSLSGTLQPGASTSVGLHFVLDKGWHIYWINAGDSGEPPMIQWKLPKGITAGSMQFPTPARLPLGPLMDFGYENEVMFPITLHATPDLKPSAQRLQAHVSWLVCREVCIPGKADLSLPLKIATTPGAPDPAAQALFERFRARLPQPLPAGAKATFSPTPAGFALAVTGIGAGVSAPSGPASSAEFFPLDQSQIDNPAPQTVRPVKDGVEMLLKKDENLSGAPAQLNGVLSLADGTAYVVHAVAGAAPAAAAEAGIVSGTGGLGNFLRIALLAFAGGVLLNLMPCVFPVLFIKGLSLLESSNRERNQDQIGNQEGSPGRSHLRMHGVAYSAGILVSFWAVVAVLLALRAGGHHLGWGFQFQSPSFLAVIALLLFFMGLSLAGMFEIGLTVTSKGGSLAARQGYGGSFFTGVLAMVVATPCAAPFMGAAIGFALVQSSPVAFAVFTALALGLAAPYMLLTLNPAWTRLLPRPGAWMEVLKQATAVPIFITVIWMVWLFTQVAGVNGLAGLLGAFLLLAVAGWILGRWPAHRYASLSAAVAIILAVLLPVYALRAFPSTESHAIADSGRASADLWQPFSEAAVEKYRAEGRPVFVDFTAEWCLSCQVNERVVLDRDDVQQRLRDSGAALMRADWTRHDEAISQALNKLGRSSIPTYVIYRPGESPRILPEVLTPGIVFDALNGLGSGPQQRAGLRQDRGGLNAR